MEYNQDTGLASVPGTALMCRVYLSAGVTKVVVVAVGVVMAAAVAAGLRGVDGGIRAFSSTVTYGPFSRDYIQFPDLARKRKLRSPNAAWVVAYRRDTFRAK